MLTVSQINKSYELKTILTNVSFTVNAGERAALLGANGSGKTALIKIITGQEPADSGIVSLNPPDLNTFYLPQMKVFAADQTIGRVIQSREHALDAIEKRIEGLSRQLAEKPDDPELAAEFDRLLASFQIPETSPAEVETTLAVLGLSHFSADTPVRILSGGQKTRLLLAAAVLSKASFLLLDEPTNDLDEEMMNWLEDWLVHFSGGVLFVSHDRAFLNHTATKILELDPVTHQISEYPGNYKDWQQRKADEADAALGAWNRQRTEIHALQAAVERSQHIAKFKKGGKADTGDKFAKAFFANRSRNTVRRGKQLEEKLDRLKNEEKLAKPGMEWKMKMEFGELTETGEQVLVLDELSVGYPGKLLISGMDLRLTRGKICVLMGGNGSGKSTLLKTILGEIPPLAGSFRLGANVRVGYLSQGADSGLFRENAYETLAPLCGLNETEIRRFLSFYLFTADEVFVPTASLSNGQRARLNLACFALTGINFLVLDEPLNHLDIASREEFESVLKAYPGTVLVVVHDRYFTERCADLVWRIVGKKLIEEDRTF